MSVEVDTARPVLVTGAAGYVAGWIVRRLLEDGATVHATLRDPGDAGRRGPLERAAEGLPGRLRIFRADLLTEGAYAEAMAGCGTVLHTASPFRASVRDPQRDLVDPALLGTRNVLSEAARTQSVRRVVVTSSCAALYTDAAECAKAPGGRLTEAIWNETATLSYQPYFFSKTLAEREAWRIAGSQDRWSLVTVNPSLILGPAIGGRPTSESFSIMRRIGRGDFRTGMARLGIGVVDVRDVAEAHLAAAFLPGAEGRHIVSGHDTDLWEVSRTLLPRFGAYPLPRRAAPKWLVWAAAPLAGLSRRYVARNVGHPFRADNARSRQALGIRYRPLRETVEEMFGWMIAEGWFARS